MLINARIERIVCAADYPDPMAKEMFAQAGVTIETAPA